VRETSMLTPFPDVGGSETFEQSFDLSKFPGLQEVDFSFPVDWRSGRIHWVPMALSTLRPTTSSRLSAIQLHFNNTPFPGESIETLTIHTSDDLRRIADEVTRIEREFQGTVKFTVIWDPGFDGHRVPKCFLRMFCGAGHAINLDASSVKSDELRLGRIYCIATLEGMGSESYYFGRKDRR